MKFTLLCTLFLSLSPCALAKNGLNSVGVTPRIACSLLSDELVHLHQSRTAALGSPLWVRQLQADFELPQRAEKLWDIWLELQAKGYLMHAAYHIYTRSLNEHERGAFWVKPEACIVFSSLGKADSSYYLLFLEEQSSQEAKPYWQPIRVEALQEGKGEGLNAPYHEVQVIEAIDFAHKSIIPQEPCMDFEGSLITPMLRAWVAHARSHKAGTKSHQWSGYPAELQKRLSELSDESLLLLIKRLSQEPTILHRDQIAYDIMAEMESKASIISALSLLPRIPPIRRFAPSTLMLYKKGVREADLQALKAHSRTSLDKAKDIDEHLRIFAEGYYQISAPTSDKVKIQDS